MGRAWCHTVGARGRQQGGGQGLRLSNGEGIRADERQTDDSPIIVRLTKGAITSKIKHAIKLKTSPARLAQLLHNWTVTVRRHWLQAKTKC